MKVLFKAVPFSCKGDFGINRGQDPRVFTLASSSNLSEVSKTFGKTAKQIFKNVFERKSPFGWQMDASTT